MLIAVISDKISIYVVRSIGKDCAAVAEDPNFKAYCSKEVVGIACALPQLFFAVIGGVTAASNSICVRVALFQMFTDRDKRKGLFAVLHKDQHRSFLDLAKVLRIKEM